MISIIQSLDITVYIVGRLKNVIHWLFPWFKLNSHLTMDIFVHDLSMRLASGISMTNLLWWQKYTPSQIWGHVEMLNKVMNPNSTKGTYISILHGWERTTIKCHRGIGHMRRRKQNEEHVKDLTFSLKISCLNTYKKKSIQRYIDGLKQPH